LSEAYLEGMKTAIAAAKNIFAIWSEAYLEGMKTVLYSFYQMLLRQSEAYLEGMKTLTCITCHCRTPLSEAYLEGMKTFLGKPGKWVCCRVRSLPRRNENVTSCTYISMSALVSEAYLEGMKTTTPFNVAIRFFLGPKPTSKE